MAKYKIGVTEAGDAGLDLSWVNKLNTVDGAVVITKCVSPDFYDAVLEHMDKLVVHATFTGYGHSVLEPAVPPPYEEFDAVMALARGGFPKEKVVIRIDPIIPTAKGLEAALNVFKTFMDVGFSRFRVSIIDMYPHVRERFRQAGFSPSAKQISETDAMLQKAIEYWQSLGNHELFEDTLCIETCAEPKLTIPIKCGCISEYDLSLLGLDDVSDSAGYQRHNCLCYSGKTELLTHKQRCPHGCLYCYWK